MKGRERKGGAGGKGKEGRKEGRAIILPCNSLSLYSFDEELSSI